MNLPLIPLADCVGSAVRRRDSRNHYCEIQERHRVVVLHTNRSPGNQPPGKHQIGEWKLKMVAHQPRYLTSAVIQVHEPFFQQKGFRLLLDHETNAPARQMVFNLSQLTPKERDYVLPLFLMGLAQRSLVARRAELLQDLRDRLVALEDSRRRK
jgi:hypothetical protein